MKVLQVTGVSKTYPSFQLQQVSFGVEEGTIMGFIGRNGAGKSTTLKAILNLIHVDGGQITYFGMDIREHETGIKQKIGYAAGAVEFYKKKKIREIMAVTKGFYQTWDDSLYKKYMTLFGIDEAKTPAELSQGMKVKLSLVMALSHGARLLILDEPTSNLDPISREELLEIFGYLKRQGVSILFSTHITSDLDKSADDITYIRDGHIIYTGSLQGFTKGERLEDVMLRYEKEAFHEAFAR